MIDLSFETCSAHILLPPVPADTVVYAIMEAREAERLAALLPAPHPVLVALDGFDWNRDLSPWKAAAVFKQGDFAGGAPVTLRALEQEIVPACEAALPIACAHRALAGYSLAGLFTLWVCAQSALFEAAASVSGSLWFDGFTPWLEMHVKDFHAQRVYLSLGDLECKTRNPRMARVGTCTQAALEILRQAGVRAVFESNPGNHFAHVEERMAKGIAFVGRREENA